MFCRCESALSQSSIGSRLMWFGMGCRFRCSLLRTLTIKICARTLCTACSRLISLERRCIVISPGVGMEPEFEIRAAMRRSGKITIDAYYSHSNVYVGLTAKISFHAGRFLLCPIITTRRDISTSTVQGTNTLLFARLFLGPYPSLSLSIPI